MVLIGLDGYEVSHDVAFIASLLQIGDQPTVLGPSYAFTVSLETDAISITSPEHWPAADVGSSVRICLGEAKAISWRIAPPMYCHSIAAT